ncbi:hypothetical protein BD289DRAFT_66228 [Coniella lustricola]|uniref:C2H2-type domain-containing protein n=1 Tax=Coniella lustricola TaxID=2025994 RepID=A0A2T3AHX4_9PEZI|nr:hypothetical protein BD289DRAFT_66228 [Coniella lustricola]
MDNFYQYYDPQYFQRQQDELTAWGPHATFNSTDLAYTDVNTQALQRSGSSNSYNSYPDSGYGSQPMQYSDSLHSNSAVNYASHSSLVAGSYTNAYPQYPNNQNLQQGINHTTPSQQQPCYSQASTASRAESQYKQLPTSSQQTGIHKKKKRTQNDKFVCLSSQCGSHFKRHKDLDRHQKHVHLPKSNLERFYCDYPRCDRAIPADMSEGAPFTRKDHCKEHLRDVHREPLPKRSVKYDPTWLDGKKLNASFWRCGSCLARNQHGVHTCAACNTKVDPDVVQARQKKFGH